VNSHLSCLHIVPAPGLHLVTEFTFLKGISSLRDFFTARVPLRDRLPCPHTVDLWWSYDRSCNWRSQLVIEGELQVKLSGREVPVNPFMDYCQLELVSAAS
jgi:hypothetical protein